MDISTIQVDLFNNPLGTFLALVNAILLPLLVQLLIKRQASAAIKNLALLVLSAVSTFITSWLQAINTNESFDWERATNTFFATILVAYLGHKIIMEGTLKLTGSRGVLPGSEGGLGTPVVSESPTTLGDIALPQGYKWGDGPGVEIVRTGEGPIDGGYASSGQHVKQEDRPPVPEGPAPGANPDPPAAPYDR